MPTSTSSVLLTLTLASSLTAQAATGELPAPTGPHPVGTVTHHWIDAGRAEDLTPDPNDVRQLIVQIWYPGAVSVPGDSAAYFPEARAVQAAFRTDRRLRRMADVIRSSSATAIKTKNGSLPSKSI